MSMKSLKTLSATCAIAAAIVLAGCGNRVPTNIPDPEEPEAPAAPASTAPAVTEPAAPVTPVVPTTPAYTAPVTGSLVITGVEKTKSGIIFFKHMTVKGSVMNTSSVPLSGTLKVEFKDKKGILTSTLVTEETKTQVISNLAPGASTPFEIKSDETGIDDAEVTVETMQPPAAAAANPATAYGAYGAPAATGVAGYPSY